VLKSITKAVVLLASLAWAGAAFAVGFGTANVQSALGEPLRVEISLISVSEQDAISLKAKLATPDNFQAVGLEYPYHLSRLSFDIVERNNRYFIRVTSKEAVTDSFVNLLIELNWRSGKLMREYTFLLDPPNYQANLPKAEVVTPIEPAVVAVPPPEEPQVETLAPLPSAPDAAADSSVAMAPTEEEPIGEDMAAESMVSAASAPAPAATEVPVLEPPTEIAAGPATQPAPPTTPRYAPSRQAQVSMAKPSSAAPETVKVRRGDTLTKIAKRYQEPDVTLEQMLVGLYRANIKQFEGRNMNRIRAGKILRLPEPEVFEHMSQKSAVREIRIQTESWNAYREKLAAAGTMAPTEMPKQQVGGKISTSVADKTPQPKPEANGTLVLSRGEAPGDKAAPGAKGPSAAAKAQQAQEEATAKAKAAEDEKMRIAKLEEMNQAMKNRIAMEGAVPAAVSAPAAPSAVASAPASAVAATPAPMAVRPKFPAAASPVPAVEKSFIEDIIDTIFENEPLKGLAVDFPIIKEPAVLGGGLGAVILLIVGAVVASRRNSGGGRSRTKKKKISPPPSKPKTNPLKNFFQNLSSNLQNLKSKLSKKK